jgi:hypothetical protein
MACYRTIFPLPLIVHEVASCVKNNFCSGCKGRDPAKPSGLPEKRFFASPAPIVFLEETQGASTTPRHFPFLMQIHAPVFNRFSTYGIGLDPEPSRLSAFPSSTATSLSFHHAPPHCPHTAVARDRFHGLLKFHFQSLGHAMKRVCLHFFLTRHPLCHLLPFECEWRCIEQEHGEGRPEVRTRI